MKVYRKDSGEKYTPFDHFDMTTQVIFNPQTGSPGANVTLTTLGKGSGSNDEVHENSDQIFYMLQGTMKIYARDELIFTIKAGDAALVTAGDTHAVRNEDEEDVEIYRHHGTADRTNTLRRFSMINYTIRQIQTGWQYLDKGLYGTYGKGYGEIIEHPVFCWLLEGGGRKILVDTGMSDTEHSVKYHHDGKQEPGQAIHEQLAKLGISPEEIEIIIFTHLHWDHCYNVEKFTNARLYASEIEYRFALDPIPFYWNSYEAPALGIGSPLDGMHFSLTQGEEEIVEGIRVYPIPGHSPGHIAVAVQTEKGIYSLIGDLVLLRECLQPYEEKGWPFTPPGRFYNIVEIWHSIEEVLRRSDHILMTHDPESSDGALFP